MSNEKNEEGGKILKTTELLNRKENEILDTWIKNQYANIALRIDLINKVELENQSREILSLFTKTISTGNVDDIEAKEYKPIIKLLQNISELRASQGYTPSETATYVFSLQDAILEYLQVEYVDQPEVINREVVLISKIFIKLGLVTFETYVKTRNEIIKNQTEVMQKMSIPVMTLWDNILMIPVIGSVDSKRAQLMMELTLNKIATTRAKIIIFDILGVPSVDSAVANHILKVTKAVKLMGCEAIISGISPEVAQTMVHLGIEITGIVSTSTLNDAQELAFKILGLKVSLQK